MTGKRDHLYFELLQEGVRYAVEAAAQLQKSCWEVARQLRQGISDEELLTVHRIMKKMQRNLDALLEQRERKVK